MRHPGPDYSSDGPCGWAVGPDLVVAVVASSISSAGPAPLRGAGHVGRRTGGEGATQWMATLAEVRTAARGDAIHPILQ